MNNVKISNYSWLTGVMRIFATLVGLLWLGVPVSHAANWYVTTNGTGWGTNGWADATNDLQGAIFKAVAGETVWVSNGVYETGGVTNYPSGTVLTNRVAITNAITVRSANNNPTNTIIKGAGPNGLAAVRCVYMASSSSLIGFMLTNGATLVVNQPVTGTNANHYGGGVYCASSSAIISNCVIAGNSADSRGGGIYYGTPYNCTLISNTVRTGSGGGAFGANCGMYNCTFIGNSAGRTDGSVQGWGGGAYQYGAAISNSTFISNSATYGGGISGGGTQYNCTFIGNSAWQGGAVEAGAGTLYNCTLLNNVATDNGGGTRGGTLYNCLLVGNQQNPSSGTGGGGTIYGTLYNCTIVGNRAYSGGGTLNNRVINCIMYFNTATTAGSNWQNVVYFTNCCTTPAATNGLGNITNDPTFIANGSGYGTSHVAGNYHLVANSPCINTGINQDWMTNSLDLDGRARIRYGAVDMGAYETIYNGTIFTVP